MQALHARTKTPFKTKRKSLLAKGQRGYYGAVRIPFFCHLKDNLRLPSNRKRSPASPPISLFPCVYSFPEQWNQLPSQGKEKKRKNEQQTISIPFFSFLSFILVRLVPATHKKRERRKKGGETFSPFVGVGLKNFRSHFLLPQLPVSFLDNSIKRGSPQENRGKREMSPSIIPRRRARL